MRLPPALRDLPSRLDPRTRRVMIFGSAAGLTFSALSTRAAIQAGSYLEVAFGGAVLLLFAAGSALAWTGLAAQRRSG